MRRAPRVLSEQCERFLNNLGRSSTCSSLLAVEFTMVYRHGFQCTFISYVFSEECKWKKIRSVDEKWRLRSANSASVDHITITLTMWRRLGASLQRLASAGPQLQQERGGAYWQTKALQTSPLSPNSHLFPNRATTAKRRPAVLSTYTVRKVWMVRSTGAGARKLFERIVRRRRDMERLIPYRTRGMVARPASGHSCRPTFF